MSLVGRKILFAIIFFILTIVGFYLKQPPPSFLAFGNLVPLSDANALCKNIKLPSPDGTSKIIWPTESLEPCSYVIKTEGLPSKTYKTYMTLAISGEGRVLVEVDGKSIRIESKGQQFADYFFEVGNDFYPLTNVHVKIKRISGGVIIRERAEFLSSPYSPLRILSKNLDTDASIQVLIVSILSLMFLYLLIYGDDSKFPFVIATALGVLLFSSPKLFYYFDEWHILERFSKLGFPGVIHTHNEHSIIAFFVWYYALVAFFGENYFALLIVSILLHVVCAFSLEKLLLTYDFDKRAVRTSAIFFLFSSLHTEVLQWAFEQAIILSCISGICALIFLRRWLKSGVFSEAVVSGLLLLLAPLCFGNGFVFFPLAFFVIFVEFRFVGIRRYLLPSIVMFVSALVPVLTYHFLKHLSSGHGVEGIRGEFDFYNFSRYLLTGSGLGTIGRGLGLYPNLTLSSVQTFCYEVLGYYVPWIDQQVLFRTSVESSLGCYFWMLLTLAMFFIFWFNGEVRKFLPASLVGLLLIILSFLLPALGRAHLGELQALSLRYQYSAMLGFSMVMCPVFYVFLKTRISKLVFYILGVIWMSEQAYLCQTFTYFTDHGDLHRVYVEELIDWEKKGMKGEGVPYEGNAEMRGLFPLARPSIVPGRHPLDILRTAKWLRGDRPED